MVKTAVFAYATFLLASGAASAQSDPSTCTSITDSSARLACFDKEMAATSKLYWSGNGMQNLPPFKISGNWTLHWTADNVIQIGISTSPNQQMPDSSVDSTAAGSWQSYEAMQGTIYLSVGVAMGPWKIWVTPAD